MSGLVRMQPAMLRRTAFTGTSVAVARPQLLTAQRAAMPVQMAQSIQGKVVSTAMPKSAVVEVTRLWPHPKYGKRINRTKRYIVHDEAGVAMVGDYVKVEPCKPVSKKKRFAVAQIIRRTAYMTIPAVQESAADEA